MLPGWHPAIAVGRRRLTLDWRSARRRQPLDRVGHDRPGGDLDASRPQEVLREPATLDRPLIGPVEHSSDTCRQLVHVLGQLEEVAGEQVPEVPGPALLIEELLREDGEAWTVRDGGLEERGRIQPDEAARAGELVEVVLP